MKLYAGYAPNAFRVLAFLTEKGISLPITELDVIKGDTRQSRHLARNSLGEIPVLELEDGSFLTESIAICRYLDATHPGPKLTGRDPLEAARIEMWNRRMEQQIMAPYAQLGLHVIPIFADKIEQVPDYAETQSRLIPKRWAWLEGELSDGRAFVAGDAFSIADITGMTALMIGGFMKIDVPAELTRVNAWKSAMEARESWKHAAPPGA